MARLQWDQVAIPNFTTANLAQAGQAITNSFAALAQTLAERQKAQEEQTFNSNAMGILGADTTEAAKAAMANIVNSADPKVRAMGAKLLALGNEHQNALINRALSNENLLAAQDAGKYDYASYQLAVKKAQATGDWSEVEAMKESMAGARKLAEYMDNGIRLGNADKGFKMDEDKFAHQRSQDAIGNSMEQQRIGIQRQSLGMQQAEHALRMRQMREKEAMSAALEKAGRMGESYGAASYGGLSTDDLGAYIGKSKVYNSLKTPQERQAFVAAATNRYGRDTAATEADLARGGVNAPAFNTLSGAAQSGMARAAVVRQAREAQELSKNPNVQAFNIAASYGDKGPSVQEVINYAEKNAGIIADSAIINKIKNDYQLTNADIMGILKTHDFSRSLLDPTSWVSSAGRFDEAAAAYSEGKRTGDLLKTQTRISSMNAPIRNKEAELTRALDKYRGLKAKGQHSPELATKIANLTRELSELQLKKPAE